MPQAFAAIRSAGFDPQPLAARKTEGTAGADDHEHGLSSGITHLALALAFAFAFALAIGAEALHFLPADSTLVKIVGLAISAFTIWPSGIETFTKGFAALHRGKLNINALMSVAVAGAFVIDQWPEAAMVMALYAVADGRGTSSGPGARRDLRRIPETIRLSRKTHAVLLQNISLALRIKAVFMVLALFGGATMWMAVFADMGATLLVVANGLRLGRS